MRNQGIYLTLWKKYLPVIRLLLKKTDAADQTLKLYKHELQKTGVSNSYVFNLKIVKGKPVYKTDSKAVAFDLMMVLSENEETAQWLKEKSIFISVNSACDMSLGKYEDERKKNIVAAIV